MVDVTLSASVFLAVLLTPPQFSELIKVLSVVNISIQQVCFTVALACSSPGSVIKYDDK